MIHFLQNRYDIQMNVLSACCPCLRSCLECMQGPSFSTTPSYQNFITPPMPSIKLDVSKMGENVILLKESERICGTGGALGTVPIVQNKAYFQVNVQQTGLWGVGIGNIHASLDRIPVVEHFWGITESGDVISNGEVIGKLNKNIEEGNCIGICYDHIELKFLVNGEWAEPSISSVKGTVYPLVYVGNSAILDVKFKGFSYDAPSGYSEILTEQTLL